MATRRIVPRNDGEGSIGKPVKQWGDIQTKKINDKTPSEFVAAENPKAHDLDAHGSVTLEELNTIISGATIPSDAAATASANGLMSASDKTKLDGIATNANNYSHPASHSASIITQDTNNRFVTDTEKSTWNGKASTSVVTTSAAGLMSASDKTKLDGLLPLWTSAGNITTTSTTGFSVTNNATNQAIYAPGRPLKVGSTYQIVASYTTGTVVLTGAALTNSTSYTVEYGDFTRVQKVDINLPGAFAVVATTTAIKTLTGDPLYWDVGPAQLVAVKHMIQSKDSTATTTQPAINVSINGTAALASNSNTATTRTVVGCGLVAVYGNAIEVTVVKATGGTPANDALDLSVSLLFVVK